MKPLALVLAVLAAPAFAQAPRVVSVSPVRETVGAPRDASIGVVFDRTIDLTTVTAESFRVFGRWSGPKSGSFSFNFPTNRVGFTPDEPFAAGEWVIVQLARTITGADGTPLEHGYAWTFWAASDATPLNYVEDYRLRTRRTGEGPVISYGGYAGDLDEDGASDLTIVNEGSVDVRVFLNDGSGVYDDFTVVPLVGGGIPSPSEGRDLDGDGHIDLAIGNVGNPMVSVLLGDGAGGFASNVTYPTAGGRVFGVTIGDFDGDGADDLVAASREEGLLSLLRGRGDGTFEAPESFNPNGSNETAVATADANGDGLLDVFVGDWAGGVSICLGDGDGGFACGAEAGLSGGGGAGLSGGGPWMLAAGDFDGDGFADVASASSSAGGVEVMYGDGAGGFSSTAFHPSGPFPIAIDAGDLDGDGDLDAVSSNGANAGFTVFENTGGALALKQDLEAVSAGSCALLHDRDGDGTLEVTGIDELADYLFFFSSQLPDAAEPEAPASGLALAPAANPFRDGTMLRFQIPTPGLARLAVYDALGREVAVLLDGAVRAGAQTVAFDASALPAGRYLARLEQGGASVAILLTLTR